MSSNYAVAPAFHLDLSKVLIARSAQSIQSFGDFETPSNSDSNIYLTALTGGNDFTASVNNGNEITYNGAENGNKLVAIVYDNNQNIIKYGSVGTADSSSGTVTIPMDGLDNTKEYTIALYSEDEDTGVAKTPVVFKMTE